MKQIEVAAPIVDAVLSAGIACMAVTGGPSTGVAKYAKACGLALASTVSAFGLLRLSMAVVSSGSASASSTSVAALVVGVLSFVAGSCLLSLVRADRSRGWIRFVAIVAAARLVALYVIAAASGTWSK